MADNNINTMQANMGLVSDMGSGTNIRTPHSSETALQLSNQATQNMIFSQQLRMSSAAAANPQVAAMMFGQQFQQQLGNIQAQQSFNPYVAQAMAMAGGRQGGGFSGYQQGYMPSPLMMTPPSSGVFRTPAPPPMAAPIPPMYTPPLISTPFTPQVPPSMFMTPADQMFQQREAMANRLTSYGAQVPNVMGQGLGYAGGAYAGARMGARFGPGGMLAGAVGGAALAGLSGVAGGMGGLGDLAMQPFTETRRMGASIQNMSRNWVVTGSDVSPMGQGLGRSPAINMASEIKNLAGDKSFRDTTGGMFNRQDLMQIMRQGGQAGLFDTEQTVPQIKDKLRQTAITIRQFMMLTQDPDVTKVIREMGRLQQFGLTQSEMITAARGMRSFSRAAATTIEGLNEIGGLPGAATFQQAGLVPGQGMMYGNFAAASARQLMASGGMSVRQASLLGGVSGIAQRDIQGQAALGSMPLFAAANAQFGRGGWGMGAGMGTGAGGAQGMVMNAIQNLNQGVQAGGIGAMAMFPLQQRMISAEAMSKMTPQEQMAQRFTLAQRTGEMLGLKGQAAFSYGARRLFGEEQGEQMLVQASSPQYWRAQQQVVERQQRDLSIEQRQRVMKDAPSFLPNAASFATLGISDLIGARGDLADIQRKVTRPFMRGRREMSAGSGAMLGAGVGALFGPAGMALGGGIGALASGESRRRLGEAGEDIGGFFNMVGAGLSDAWANSTGVYDEGIYRTRVPRALGGAGRGLQEALSTGNEAAFQGKDIVLTTPGSGGNGSLDVREALAARRRSDRTREISGDRKSTTSAADAIDRIIGGSQNLGMSILKAAGRKLDKRRQELGGGAKQITSKEYRQMLFDTVREMQPDLKDADVERIVSSIYSDPSTRQDTEALMEHYGQTYSTDPSTWGSAEEAASKKLIDRFKDQTEINIKAIRDNVNSVEESMGLDFNAASGYSAREQKLQTFLSSYSPEEALYMALSAAEESGDTTATAKKTQLVKSSGKLTNVRQEELDAKLRTFGNAEKDAYDKLRVAGETATLEGMTQSMRASRQAGEQQGFGNLAMKWASKMSTPGAILSPGGEARTITAASFAAAFSDEDIKELRKTPEGKGLADALTAFKTKGSEVELRKLGAGALGAVTPGEREDKVLFEAGGEKAQELKRAKGAMAGMENMFKDFVPASSNFLEGSRMLVEFGLKWQQGTLTPEDPR